MTTTTRVRRHQRTKQAILDAALEIVNQSGPMGLSMRALADRIDYSPAGLYEYFDGKDEIVGALCEQGNQMLCAAMDAVDRGLPMKDYMLGIGLAYVRFALESSDHFLLMFGTPPPADAAVPGPEMMHEGSAFPILVSGIQRGIAEGVFKVRPGFDWLDMAYAAWVTVHGIAMLRITSMRGLRYDFETADRQALENFYRGLTTP